MIEQFVIGLASAILGGATIFGGIYLYGRIKYWQGMYETSANDLNAALAKISESEKLSQAMAEKYAIVKEFTQQMLQRPVVAALTDEQVQQVAGVLSQLVVQNMHPNRLN